MRSLIGELADSTSIDIASWFQELGNNLLEAVPVGQVKKEHSEERTASAIGSADASPRDWR